MKSSNRVLFIITVVCAVIIAIACGGGGHNNNGGGNGGSGGGGGSQPSKPTLQTSARPANHVFAVKKTTAVNLNPLSWLVQPVYAQVQSTVSVAQSIDGSCSASPQNPGGTVGFIVFGLGQTNQPGCNQFWFPGDTDGAVAAANAQNGKRIWGAGTASNLVVSTDKGTVISSTGGVPVHIWVKRGGNVVDTGIKCTLPQGVDELACQATATFALQDGDRAIATAVVGGADVLVNVNVGFTKSL